MADWRIKRGDEEFSTGNLNQLRSWVRNGRVVGSDLIYHPTLEKWLYASEVQEIKGELPSTTATGKKVPTCPSCGGTIASNTSTCPHCGKKFTSPAVGLLAGCFALVALVFLVAICAEAGLK
jgi:hypothetical protein